MPSHILRLMLPINISDFSPCFSIMGLSFFVRGFPDANLVVTKNKIPSAAQLIIQP